MAMENHPFIVDFPIQTSVYRGFPSFVSFDLSMRPKYDDLPSAEFEESCLETFRQLILGR
jgi:hypothetical protein